jgi:hypothetical protein
MTSVNSCLARPINSLTSCVVSLVDFNGQQGRLLLHAQTRL